MLATKGIEDLGGINFTNALAVALGKRYEQVVFSPYPSTSKANIALVEAAEKAKCQLSEVQSTTVHLAPPQGRAADIEITREQFESQIDLLLFQLQIAVEQALERANKRPADIQRVLLCGGSSRIPAVQAMLTDFFGRRPESTLDLDLSVALGAAYLAASYKEDAKMHTPTLQLEEGLVIDCVSYPVGIAVKNARGEDIKLTMLQTGDSLDTWSQPFAVRILGSSAAFPPIDVYSGEGTQLQAKDHLGNIMLTLPPGIPSGTRATVMMRQDQSGLVQVQINVAGRDLPGNLRRV